MVYKKYIRKKGVLYGPYLYENKRVNGKIVTTYHGIARKDSFYSNKYFILSGVFILIFAVTLLLIFSNNNFFTGMAILNIKESYKEGDKLTGKISFDIKEGEFIPKNSSIIVSLGEKQYDFILSDIINNEIDSGNFFYENTSISGGGEGYGLIGEKKIYPFVDFELNIFNDSANFTVSGIVTKDKNFAYNLNQGENAEIVSGSVKVNGEQVGDKKIDLKINDRKAIVTTEHFIVEKGFGADYLGNDNLTLEIDLNKLNLNISGNELKVGIVYENEEIDSVERELNIDGADANAVEIETSREDIVAGKPVKWIKNVSLEVIEDVSIELEKGAENISVKKIVDGAEEDAKIKIENSVNKERGIRRFFEKEDKNEIDNVSIVLADEATDYVIEYYTEAPKIYEENTSNGKIISVSAPDELNYTDVTSFASVPEIYKVGEENKIKIYWKENNSFVLFNASDIDEDGVIDYVEWNVPHLSNQTFEIILISNAEHLDKNRGFVSDVFEQVRARDGNWTELIPAGDYLRVSFERKLDKTRDITLYARSVSGGNVEVYEKDKGEKIADFGGITEDKQYKIYLTNLVGEQDSFDLKIVSGSVQFDYVVDPNQSACGTLNTANTVYTLNASISSSGTCFNITAANVTLDCQGYTINYSQGTAGYGVISNAVNTTIMNCLFDSNSSSPDTTYSITFDGASFNRVSNNIFIANVRDQIRLQGSSIGNVIDNNTINFTTNGGAGIAEFSTTGGSNLIKNNRIQTLDDRLGAGIYLSSNNSIIDNNTFIGPGTIFSILSAPIANTYLIYLNSVSNITIINNNITTKTNHTALGILGNANTYYNHTVYNNTVDGLPLLYISNNNSMVIRNADYSSTYGMLIIAGSSNVTVDNLTIKKDGLSLFGVSNSSITNLHINASNRFALTMIESSNNIINGSMDCYLVCANVRSSNNNTFVLNVSSIHHGLFLIDSNNNVVDKSTILSSSSNSIGFYITSSTNLVQNNSLTNSFINSTSDTGLYIVGNDLVSDIKIINSTVAGKSEAVSIDSANRTSIINSKLYAGPASGSDALLLFRDGSFDNNVIDTQFFPIAFPSNDVNFVNTGERESSVQFINDTFNRSSVSYIINGKLDVRWWLDVNVTSSSSAIQNANISVYMNNGTYVESKLSDSNGYARFNLTQYNQNKTKTLENYNNYTVNVSSSSYNTASKSVNMSTNVWLDVNMTLAADTEYPIFSSFTFIPANNTEYSSNAIYRFNATITSTNGTVKLEFNGINYTAFNSTGNVFNLSISNLAAGTYNYYWLGWGNGTSHNYNTTAINAYTIAVNTTGNTITPLLNGANANLNIIYPQQINASFSGANQTAVNISINGSSISIGLNYTWGAGGWVVNYSMPSNQNYSSFFTILNLTINRTSSQVNLTLNGTASNISITQGDSILLNGTLITGDSSATLRLYNNESLINQGTREVSNTTTFSNTGLFNITIIYITSQNYSQSSLTYYVNVTSAPSSPSSSSSSGGGGGGGVSPNRGTEVGTFRVSVNTIDRTINVGEEIFENILVVNTAKVNTTVGLSTNISALIDKTLVGIISINNKVEIPPFDSRDVRIRIFGLKEGIYLGNIYFFGKKITERWIDENISEEYNTSVATSVLSKEIIISNATYILPVRIVVKSVEPKLIDLKVILDKLGFSPGEDLGFEISAINLGSLSKYGFNLRYEVLDKEGNLIISKDEFAEINNSLSLKRSLALPADLELGDYELDVMVFYDDKTASAKESFTVGRNIFFSPFEALGGFAKSVLGYLPFVVVYLPLILAGLFILIVAIILIYYFRYLRQRLFEKKIEEKKKQSIYVFPDFKLLPKSRFAYIGEVADSGVKTYLDYTQLNRHTLIAGGTGCGKTVSGMVIVEELLKKGGYPVIVFDPVGQWTGFLEKNKDKAMKSLYRKFSVGGARAFNARIIEVSDKNMGIDIVYYLKKSGLSVFKLDKLSPKNLDKFIGESLEKVYRAKLSETGALKSLVVLDEVHRLLPKYGGSKAHIKLEQAVREFRKWGIGLLMISQVLTDFKGAIRGNIGTEIQMRSRYEGDIKRVRDRHGNKISSLVAKMPTGIGMLESSDYNKGNPYFIEFRPLLHSQFKVSEHELKKYLKKEKIIFSKEEKSEKKEIKKEKIIERLRKHRVKIKKIFSKNRKAFKG